MIIYHQTHQNHRLKHLNNPNHSHFPNSKSDPDGQNCNKPGKQCWANTKSRACVVNPNPCCRTQMLYILKMCSTKKAYMVCNGNPRQQGTVTLGLTYANSLDAASERLFWALVAKEGLIAIEANVLNAFADAPLPKAPLYLYIDDAFREWWNDYLGKPPIPRECNVVWVNYAIQGHRITQIMGEIYQPHLEGYQPHSSHSWAMFILRHHHPALYDK